MRKTYCLFANGTGRGHVVAVQDTFGKAYRRLRQSRRPGEIISTRFIAENETVISLGEDGISPSHFKVLAPVHINTVRSVLRRTGRGHLAVSPGYWYEVHGD